jgi:hypothetical protein
LKPPNVDEPAAKDTNVTNTNGAAKLLANTAPIVDDVETETTQNAIENIMIALPPNRIPLMTQKETA